MITIHNVAERWSKVGIAVRNKKKYPDAFDRIYIGKLQERESHPIHYRRAVKQSDRRLQRYFSLSEPLAGIFLTRREAQVLYLICHGATNKDVAEKMALSSRTTEYYINNIRKKTTTASKRHLICRIIETDFLTRIDVEKLFSDSCS